MRLCIIDTGSANLNSVAQACQRLRLQPEISSDPEVLDKAQALILPGVGSASSIMRGVREHKLEDFITKVKVPLLGICLGMQIMSQGSEEVPQGADTGESFIPTLGLVAGRTQKLKGAGLRLPHMGWNSVEHSDHPLFLGIRQGAFFYFDHSYAVEIGDCTIGVCEYGQRFSAALARDNFMGVQFHPEKSGPVGERLLQNFFELTGDVA
ncbi:MAG: imidazole glycerol phosphate synthase subunit HisH [Succinivibrio sp.]|nr:imidazole glycerol phosphate synthase subunit HisH [Succinivibrio sp.]